MMHNAVLICLFLLFAIQEISSRKWLYFRQRLRLPFPLQSSKSSGYLLQYFTVLSSKFLIGIRMKGVWRLSYVSFQTLFTFLSLEFKKNAIFAHNKARSQHVDTSALTWDDNLASSSSKYATTLMLKNLRSTNPSPSFYQMPHSADNVGENIYMGHNGQYSYTERTVMDAVSAW